MTATYRNRIAVNRFSAMTVLAAIILICTVPQIAALLPMHWPLSKTEWLLAVFALVLTALYTLAWLSAVPVMELGDDEHLPRSSRMHRLHEWLAGHGGNRIDSSLRWLREHRQVPATTFLVSVLMLWLGWVAPFAINLAVLSLWLLFRMQWLKKALTSNFFETPPDKVHTATILVGRSITLILLTSAAGELLWTIVGALPYATGYRAYSAWAVVQTLFACLLTVRAFDGLAMLGLPWIRTKAFLALLAVGLASPGGETIGTLRSGSPGPAHAGLPARMPSVAAPLALRSDWLDDLETRLREVPQDEPVLFVAASGGGSRAAIVASLSYELLASIKTKPSTSRTLADNVVLISSVSGGSLATAYFASGGVNASRELLDRTQTADGFAGEMSVDFMAPLLRGILTANIERGTSVAQFWRERYKWQEITDDSPRAKGRPLVIFNATSVQSGARVGIGFPGLPSTMLKPALVVADIAPNLRLNLADAVRLSANFPYGFEYAVLADDGTYGHGGDRQLIDGGIIDNTGLDTISYLMDGLQRSASLTADDPIHRRRAEAGQRVLAELRLRGVLLVEIDAGARPSSPSRFAEHFSSFNKPLEALGQAGHLNAAVARKRHLDAILRALETEDAVPPVVGTVRIGFDCDAQGDVMTAWALDDAQLEKVQQKFAALRPRVQTTTVAQFKTISFLQRARRQSRISAEETVVKDAAKLRATYETYLDVARVNDENHHLNARSCQRSPNREQAAAHEALKALQQTLATISASAADDQDVVAKLAAAPASARQSNTSPGGQPVTMADPADEPRSSGLGWIYLGELIGDGWKTRYTSWDKSTLPPQNTRLQLLTASNVRSAKPDQFGRLAPARISLPARTQLEVLEVIRWQDSGLIWARVTRPAAPTKN